MQGAPIQLGKMTAAALAVFGSTVLIFLAAPTFAIAPLSFNSASFLTYPLAGFSLRWYQELWSSPQWHQALTNSLHVAAVTTLVATPMGALAALGLMGLRPGIRTPVMGVLLSPMIIPTIVTSVAAYFLYAPLGLTASLSALILAHIVLSTPFVVVVVLAALQGFDANLLRAGASLGATPSRVIFTVLLPMISPGVAAGAVFAFMTSFDEIVMALFLTGPGQRTLPLQMFDGVREQISPTLLAVATLFSLLSVLLLGVAELLRRRGRK